MKIKRKLRFFLCLMTATVLAIAVISLLQTERIHRLASGGYIKWVDFNVSAAAMSDALAIDLETHNTDTPIDWVDLLAYLGAKYGGSFKSYKKADLTAFADKLKNGQTIAELTAGMTYFSYYREAYGAVLDGYVGSFYRDGTYCYGLRVYSPIAEGFYYEHYDDFGASRDYGYRRHHLGHDLMSSIGTPIIAVESGYVEAIGWNQYGGWRIGIRSFDNKRYYYYAHLRRDHPYAPDLQEGDIVTAGDVIGYLGMTGYSVKENVNNINIPHLHFGIQLIFDVSQKDGVNQIWIDLYELTKFLHRNRMAVVRTEDGKDYAAGHTIVLPDMPD